MNVKLNSNTGETIELTVKSDWQDITAADYIEMQGKNEVELMEMLTGLTPEQAEVLDMETAAFFVHLLTGFESLPSVVPDVDIEKETVGQFETAKSFLRRFYREDATTARAKVLPIVYGLYKAEKVSDKWSNAASMALAEKAKGMPSSEVIPWALAVLEQLERVSKKYEQLSADHEAETDEAGVDEMDAFGFYPALHMLAGGDILKHEAVMQLSVRTVYTHLYYLKKHAANQKQNAI